MFSSLAGSSRGDRADLRALGDNSGSVDRFGKYSIGTVPVAMRSTWRVSTRRGERSVPLHAAALHNAATGTATGTTITTMTTTIAITMTTMTTTITVGTVGREQTNWREREQ